MKIIYTGLESSGKSLMLAKKIQDLVYRNRKWKKKYGFVRQIYSNLVFSDEFYKLNSEFIVYWYDYRELLGLNGVDIVWDEISSDFSSLKKEPLPRRVNRWLRQGAKQGVHIYSTAQEFHDLHLDVRRRMFKAHYVSKPFGSRRGGQNLPPVKKIWGLCLTRELKIRPYNELQPEYHGVLPGFFFIRKKDCLIFNTSQVIRESGEFPLEHVERFCSDPKCSYYKKPVVSHR